MGDEINPRNCNCPLKSLCYSKLKFCAIHGIKIHGTPKDTKINWDEVAGIETGRCTQCNGEYKYKYQK